MEFCIFTEPQQGATYDQQLAVARRAEELGFDGYFRSDHYLKIWGTSGLPGPTDSWVTLAALGRETARIRLGTLVTSATFRHPGPLAISVAQADQMSGGRVELGIGAGWYDDEHDAYGIPFPPVGERFDRLEDQLTIITGMWATPPGETFDYDGKRVSVHGSPGLPKPVQQPHPPIIIGGGGPRRTPRLAARFASEFNVMFPGTADRFTEWRKPVQQALDDAGRDPASMRWSAPLVLCCGRDDADYARRAAAIGRDPKELRKGDAAGTPAEVADKLAAFEAAGADRIYLQFLDLDDLDQLQLVASEVTGRAG